MEQVEHTCDKNVATDRWASSIEIRKAGRSHASGPLECSKAALHRTPTIREPT